MLSLAQHQSLLRALADSVADRVAGGEDCQALREACGRLFGTTHNVRYVEGGGLVYTIVGARSFGCQDDDDDYTIPNTACSLC